MDNPGGLTTCTHYGASLTTGRSPTGLTRFACLAPLALSCFPFQGNTGDLPPCFRMVGGWSFGESFALPGRPCQVGAFPSIVPDGAGAIATGAARRQERAAAGFMGLAHPSPVPACLPLGGALEGIRSSALHSAARAGNPGQVGGKSAEGYTLAKIDVQGCTDARGVDKIAARPRINHFPGSP